MKIVKQFVLELGLVLIIAICAVMTLLLATASIILVWVRRKQIKEEWRRMNDLWTRFVKHYRYLWGIVSGWLEDRRAKRAEVQFNKQIDTALEEKTVQVVQSVAYTRHRSMYNDDLDPFAIAYILLNAPYWLYVAITLVNFVYVSLTIQFIYYNPMAQEQEVQIPVNSEFEPTVADQQEIDLCPCVFQYELDESQRTIKFKNFALIESTGEVKFSTKYYVEFDQDIFQTFANLKVKNPQKLKNGKVSFIGANRNTYTVNPYQAFQFMDTAFWTFMFDDSGTLWAAQTTEITLKEVQ